jgi:hypothetical protein
MIKIYFYPRVDYKATQAANPYVLNLITALSIRNTIANTYNNKVGVLDFLKYLFKVDMYLFNWIENLSVRRFGKLQVIFFSGFLIVAKTFKKKIIWILHDKYSHDRSKNLWTDHMFNIMMKYSDLIITHSGGGIDLITDKFPKHSYKVRYIIHPLGKIKQRTFVIEKKYDFLIWGVILPYKGILEFLKYIHESEKMRSLKILIVGKCPDKEYKLKLNRYLSENIIHHDRFYDIEDISRFASQSKYTLFTYKSESVLSSGSLMDSIGMGSLIIGPNTGAFKDLSSYNFVKTYNSFNDIIEIYNNNQGNSFTNHLELDSFCLENSWENFGEKIFRELTRV